MPYQLGFVSQWTCVVILFKTVVAPKCHAALFRTISINAHGTANCNAVGCLLMNESRKTDRELPLSKEGELRALQNELHQ